MDKIKDNKILNTIIELILIIIIIFLLLHNCNLQKEKNKKKPTGNVDIIEIKCDNIETCTIDKDNKQNDTKQSTSILPVINKSDNDKEEVKEIEPDKGLVVVDNYTVNWNGKKDLKIFTNSAYELTDRISPESSDTYKFVVKNKTEYDLKYKITFIETNENGINMKYKLRKNDDYIVDNYTSYQNLNLQNQELSKGENDTYYLDWKWISSQNDTHVGEIQAEYKLKIEIEAESINNEEDNQDNN